MSVQFQTFQSLILRGLLERHLMETCPGPGYIPSVRVSCCAVGCHTGDDDYLLHPTTYYPLPASTDYDYNLLLLLLFVILSLTRPDQY